MQKLRSIFFAIYLGLITLVLGIICLPYAVFFAKPKNIRDLSIVWSKAMLFGLKLFCGLKYKEIGTENKLPSPAIYVANHQSQWETLVMNVFVKDIAIVLKESLLSYPIWGWYLRKADMIPIQRGSPVQALKKMTLEAQRAVDQGRSILIFPEGTRKDVHENAKFHRGVVELQRHLNIPIIPIAHNAGLFWPARSFLLKKGVIHLKYLPPIYDDANLEDIRKQIFQEKEKLVFMEEEQSA